MDREHVDDLLSSIRRSVIRGSKPTRPSRLRGQLRSVPRPEPEAVPEAPAAEVQESREEEDMEESVTSLSQAIRQFRARRRAEPQAEPDRQEESSDMPRAKRETFEAMRRKGMALDDPGTADNTDDVDFAEAMLQNQVGYHHSARGRRAPEAEPLTEVADDGDAAEAGRVEEDTTVDGLPLNERGLTPKPAKLHESAVPQRPVKGAVNPFFQPREPDFDPTQLEYPLNK